MRIGVDMHVLQGMHQGSRTYLEGLYGALLRRPSIHDWFLLINPAPYPVPAFTGDGFTWLPYAGSSRVGRLWEGMNQAVREANLDCLHTQYVLPMRKTSLEVVTIHDILFESHPECFPLISRLLLKTLVRRSARRAEAVLTVSNYSRQELIHRYDLDPAKVHVTPNAINSNIFNPGDRSHSKVYVQQHYGLGDYLLSVGRLEPRKNYLNLLRAFSLLRQRRRDNLRLVIVGARDFGFEPVIRTIRSLGLESACTLLENIPDADLAHLYRGALGFVYPSFAEGFGIPVIESLATGCPVACSGATAMADVVKAGCALEFDPHQPEAILAALENLLEDTEATSLRVRGGLAFAAGFSWERSAEVLSQVMASLALNCPIASP